MTARSNFATGLWAGTRAPTIKFQAARSGKQNIAEGSMASGISKKTELKLVGVARASLEELLLDFEDFLRQKGFSQWDKNNPVARTVRNLAWVPDRSYKTYRTFIEENSPEIAANAMICVTNQTNYLLNRLLRQLEEKFVAHGGFTEKLYRVRTHARGGFYESNR